MSSVYKGPDDPLWYKDAIIYELHVRAFADSDGDGIGDFRGLTEKLDYLQDLGVNTLWLLPFYPSPLKDDGYDISDHMGVHPSYGSIADFRTFLREAHRRGLRVVTELILNHTSDQHPWFQRARRAPAGHPDRDWYVWSDTPNRYKDVRVIFNDFEPSNWTWDPVAKAYYWHRFYAHQPDLNFDHPEVVQSILKVADFWLEQGVDGFRLDAIPYLYEREGTPCENLPETHAFLRTLRKHIDDRYPNRMLLAEANQWPEDASAYFGKGDECHMAFHFPIMTRLFLTVHMEDRYPMVDILAQTPALPDASQWALFLRNHDELTLEMVTDQERDYMYRVYAEDRAARINLGIRRRLAPLLGNNRKKIELLNALLFSLPGTPVVYYGDEIGMGDNIFLGDRNGVRTPMQWSGDRNAGFSRANAQRLYLPVGLDPEYHYEAVNVEAQQANPHSLLWWMKRLLALSRRFKAFGRGSFELLTPENRKVLAFLRRYEDEAILVVANLSRFAQYVELDLRSMQGRVPTELFGRSPFPRIGESPYLLTLGPHSFYWFVLETKKSAAVPASREEPSRTLDLENDWSEALSGRPRQMLETALVAHLRKRAWFSGGSRVVRSSRIQETVRLPLEGINTVLMFVQVDYEEGEPETYSIPLSFAEGEAAGKLRKNSPEEVVIGLRLNRTNVLTEGVLYNALADEEFVRAWLMLMTQGIQVRPPAGKVGAPLLPGFDPARLVTEGPLFLSPAKNDQHYTTLVLHGGFALRWFRRVQDGPLPELEVALFNAGRPASAPVAPWAGYWEYLRKGRDPITLAALQEGVTYRQDAWGDALDELGRYFETVRSAPLGPHAPAPTFTRGIASVLSAEPAADAKGLVGPYLESVRMMAGCLARFHQSIVGDVETPAFAPESLSAAQFRSVYQALRRKAGLVYASLRRFLKAHSPAWSDLAERALAQESSLLQTYQGLLKKTIGSTRIRCHGDFTLRHLASTGNDYVVTSAPGPGTGPFIERRIKRSPLWDVAAMIRSFHEVVSTALADQESLGEVAVERWTQLEKGAAAWYGSVVHTFLAAYRESVTDPRLKTAASDDSNAQLKCGLLERSLDELQAALFLDASRAPAVLRHLLDLLGEGVGSTKAQGTPSPVRPEIRNEPPPG